MNFFRALSYVNITGSVLKAVVISILTLVPVLNFIGIPIVLGYIVRTIPDVIDGSPDLPSIVPLRLMEDFFKGLAVGMAGIAFFGPSILVIHQFNLWFFLQPAARSGYYISGSSLSQTIMTLVFVSTLTASALLFIVGTIRFALTNDARAYLHVKSAAGLVVTHPWQTISFLINVCVSFSLLGLGMIGAFTIIGWLLFYAIWLFVLCYLMARYASDLGLASMKMKRKNDLLYAPPPTPEKQKSG